MAKRHKVTGLAPIELLVLLLVLVFLGSILVLLFPQKRSYATRMVCGANLAGLGKAVMLYSNDYGGDLPRAGAREGVWGQTADWMAADRNQAYALQADGSGGAATIGSSLYLLVKYIEVTPRTFLCRGNDEAWEKGVTAFRLDDYPLRDKRLALADLWDFGPDPTKHCSYAYQMVYASYRLTVSTDSGMPIAGDRNPWMDAPAAKARDFSLFTPDVPPFRGTSDQARQGNTNRHRGDGQNLVFLDTHVNFEKRPYCGYEDDNIYTSWDAADKARGKPPKLGSQPAGERDSLLVNDPLAPRK